MRLRTALISACIAIGAMAALVWAADVSGKWVAQAGPVDVSGKWIAQVPGRGGQTRLTTFTFKSNGGKLTGTVSGMQGDNEISDGKVYRNLISFTVALSFNGNDIKMNYNGEVSGNEIKFIRTVEGGGQTRRPQRFTAKRSST